MHHKIFDRGGWTISNDHKILVSERVNGTEGDGDWLIKYHGHKIKLPQRPDYYPQKEFIDWNHNQVFKGPEMYLSS